MFARSLVLCLAIAAPCAAFAGDLSGTALYRERIALPPDAEFSAILYDVATGDQVEIARFDASGDMGPPFAFEIDFPDDAITDGGSYVVTASIAVEGRPFFAGDMAIDGLPTSGPDISIVMTRALAEAEMSNDTSMPDAIWTVGAHGMSLPATYQGSVTFGDRSEAWHLTLDTDQSFQLARTFGSGDSTRDSLGRWSADAVNNTLVLHDGSELPLTVRKNNANELEVIDTNTGEAAEGVLMPAETVERVDLDGIFLGGMMTYLADAAVFEDCLSGVTFPVSTEGDYLALEQAYLSDRPAPGEPLYVMVEGGIATRPAMEGDPRQMVVVERFIRTRPEVTCERQMADASLQNTYWRIDTLDGAAFPRDASDREPHLVLETGNEPAYRGKVGCNQIRGRYTLDGDTISFGPGAMTMMACPEPLGQLERQFGAALAESVAFEIEGETLLLKDDSGSVRAIFTAVYF